jgi:hypothetical protein
MQHEYELTGRDLEVDHDVALEPIGSRLIATHILYLLYGDT